METPVKPTFSSAQKKQANAFYQKMCVHLEEYFEYLVVGLQDTEAVVNQKIQLVNLFLVVITRDFAVADLTAITPEMVGPAFYNCYQQQHASNAHKSENANEALLTPEAVKRELQAFIEFLL